MATRKATTKPKDNPFIARLKALGCVFCHLCYGFRYPEHTEHTMTAFADTHLARGWAVIPAAPVTLADEPWTMDDQPVAA